MSLPTGVTARGCKTASLPAPGIPYYTPAQDPPAATPVAPRGADAATAAAAAANVPTLFTPLRIRGIELSNRFVVSPMCTYSADDGHLTDFHVVHLGQYALHGAALTIVEATAVTRAGRLSPEDAGLWSDSQIAPLRRVADFVHGQGQHLGIQLAHGGRKAGARAPWHETQRGAHQAATPDEGGWPSDIVAPSSVPYAPDWATPATLTLTDIEGVVTDFAAAARRAVAAGVDLIEIHAAHGYLLTQFMSPQTNRRTDAYGGTWHNRIRLLEEVISAIRAVIPAGMPLFVRLSATEWLEAVPDAGTSWTVEDTIRLAARLPALGVDLLDVSSGGNVPHQKIRIHPYFQADLAAAVRDGLRSLHAADTASTDPVPGPLLIGMVGMVTTAEMARDVVQQGSRIGADLVFIGRQFLREPEFVLRCAHQLGLSVRWPLQYQRAQWSKKAKI